MLEKKFQSALCISEIDEETMCELQFAFSLSTAQTQNDSRMLAFKSS